MPSGFRSRISSTEPSPSSASAIRWRFTILCRRNRLGRNLDTRRSQDSHLLEIVFVRPGRAVGSPRWRTEPFEVLVRIVNRAECVHAIAEGGDIKPVRSVELSQLKLI